MGNGLITENELSANLSNKITPYVVATGEANIYVVSSGSLPTALMDGLSISVLIPIDSTGASTLNWNGLGAIPILKANGTSVTNLKANGVYTLRYYNGNFILQGEGGR